MRQRSLQPSPIPMHRLERRPRAELQGPPRPRGGDGAVALRGPPAAVEADRGVEAGEGDLVEDVEGLRPELELDARAEAPPLRERDVPLPEARPDQDVPAA